MFDEICSIYKDAHDAKGKFVDYETGECITQMSIREFCLTDRWKSYVQHLRAMRKEFGSKAKKMQEYIDTKKKLPGATLSGLFALYEDDSLTHPGQRVMVSRRESHLQQHTGWLAIDIDLADNAHLSNFENVRFACSYRPEIALLMRSCSGSGYFGLVKLAYPERHKDQFKALLKDYAAIGITLDKACSNIGRVRFASWDDPEHIYINENVVPYEGVDDLVTLSPLPKRVFENQKQYENTLTLRQSGQHGDWVNDTPDIVLRKARLLVEKIEQRGVNICGGHGGYDIWLKCGMSLHCIDPIEGYDMWKRVSRFRPLDANHGHRESDFVSPWCSFGSYKGDNPVTANSFFKLCKNNDVTFSREDMREIYG